MSVSLSHSHAPTWRMDGNGCMKSLHQFKLRALTRDMRNKSIEASLCDVKASSSCQWPLWMAYVSTRIQFRAFLVDVNSCIHRIPISHKNGCFSLALLSLSHDAAGAVYVSLFIFWAYLWKICAGLFFPIHVISAWKAICLWIFPNITVFIFIERAKNMRDEHTFIERKKNVIHGVHARAINSIVMEIQMLPNEITKIRKAHKYTMTSTAEMLTKTCSQCYKNRGAPRANDDDEPANKWAEARVCVCLLLIRCAP